MKKRRLLYVSAANFTLVEQLVHTIFTGDYSYSTCGLCCDMILSAQASGIHYSAFVLCCDMILSALAFDFCILLLRTQDVNLGS
jgi:hypothetical protein